MDEHERALFERSIRAALDSHTGGALDAVLHQMGWYEALTAHPRAAISTLFELAGEGNTSPSVDGIMAWALGSDDPSPAVVLPAFGSWDAPARRHGPTVTVNGLGTGRLPVTEAAVVATNTGAGTELLTIPTAQLDLRPILGLDPALELLEVAGRMEVGSVPARGANDEWRSSVALGQLALSHQLVGAARSMLALARAHALERIQFDRPISSFQAVRHRLAESLVAIEAAQAAVDGAWDDGSPFTASVAKATAGRSARIVSRHAQQVLAGMGFTAEHPLHRVVKRTLALDQVLGAADPLTRSIGDHLIQSRTVPAGLPL